MNIIKIILSLVRIIEVSDYRGSDNRGSIVLEILNYDQDSAQKQMNVNRLVVDGMQRTCFLRCLYELK